MRYEIRVRGTAERTIAAALDGTFQMSTEQGMTVLRGDLADQSALFGVLNRIERLGLTLVAVQSAPTATEGSP